MKRKKELFVRVCEYRGKASFATNNLIYISKKRRPSSNTKAVHQEKLHPLYFSSICTCLSLTTKLSFKKKNITKLKVIA
jgi:hypothetical protein